MNKIPDQRDAGTLDRHHRQRLLPMIGDAGQELLRAAHAAIVGCGALGSAVAETLCRAGVGCLTIIDRDVVELTNLQRQTLYTEQDARQGLPKAIAAKQALGRIDSGVVVHAIVDDVNPDTINRLLPPLPTGEGRGEGSGLNATHTQTRRPPISLLIDAADNFETRFLLNDFAVQRGLPLVYAGVVGVTGLTTTILPRPHSSESGATPKRPLPWRPTPCLRCLFDDAPPAGSAPTCDTAGVLGPAVAIVAGFQTVEAIKILLGRFDEINCALLEINAWTGALRRIDTANALRNDCPCCAQRRFDSLDGKHASQTISLCGSDSIQIAATAPIDLAIIADRLAPHGRFERNEHLLRGVFSGERSDTGEPIELTLFPTGRVVIKGLHEPGRAKAIFARYIGM